MTASFAFFTVAIKLSYSVKESSKRSRCAQLLPFSSICYTDNPCYLYLEFLASILLTFNSLILVDLSFKINLSYAVFVLKVGANAI